MCEIVGSSAVIIASSDDSRKDSSELSSRYFRIGIEFGHIHAHESELTREGDIEFHLYALIADIVECALLVGVGDHIAEHDSEDADHLGHMRSEKLSLHIRFLDGVHRRDAMRVCPEIGVVQFRRIR